MISLRQDVPLIAAVISVNVMSLLDAISTGLLVDNDSTVELNPLMDALMERSYLEFFVAKLLLTLVGTLVCWHYYGRRGRARAVLKLISRVYCALMIWHALLLLQVIG